MDAIINVVTAWPVFIQRAFTEHALAVAFITVAAVGIFVVLQQEVRPYSLPTNIVFVAGGWLVCVSVLVFVMAALRKGWMMLEQAMPFAAKLSDYLLGICERHPMVALAIVGAGTTAYFLKQPWPAIVSWGPVRALCAVFGIALAIHIAGPIADMVTGQAPARGSKAKPAAHPAEKTTSVSPEQAVAQAIRVGDFRYLSVRQCVDEVSGYPVPMEVSSPWTVGVRPLGASCYESLGHEVSVRMNKHHEYAAEYNRRMYEYNRSARGSREQLGYAPHRSGVHR